MKSARAYRIGGQVIAFATVAAGIAVVAATSMMQVSPVYAAAGPQLFPYLIGGATIVIGLFAMVEAFRGTLAPEGELELDLMPAVIMAGGLLLQLFTLEALGWVPATTALFMAGARAFGPRNLLMDFIVGLILSAVTLIIFDQWLGLRLPFGDLFFGS
jgi:putative tricarboxylic transport membrane protein